MDIHEAAHEMLALARLADLRRTARQSPEWAAVYRGFRPAALTRDQFLRRSDRFAAEPALFDSLCHVFLDGLDVQDSPRLERRLAAALRLPALDEAVRGLCEDLATLYRAGEEPAGEAEPEEEDGDETFILPEALEVMEALERRVLLEMQVKKFEKLVRRLTRRLERAERQVAEAREALRQIRDENRGLRKEVKQLEKRETPLDSALRVQTALVPLQQENERLVLEAGALQDRVTELLSELAAAREGRRLVDAWYTRQRAGEREAAGEPEPETIAPASVREAVRSAADGLPNLVFLEAAFESAENSPYRYPARVYGALKAIDTVFGSKWLMEEVGERFPGVREEFRRLGFAYKARESDTAKGKWPEQYGEMYKGRLVSIQQHIALGASFDPKDTLRIHFYVDEGERRVVVAHVGRHKTNTRT